MTIACNREIDRLEVQVGAINAQLDSCRVIRQVLAYEVWVINAAEKEERAGIALSYMQEPVATRKMYILKMKLAAMKAYVIRDIGAYANILHETISPDNHVDICIIEPAKQRNSTPL